MAGVYLARPLRNPECGAQIEVGQTVPVVKEYRSLKRIAAALTAALLLLPAVAHADTPWVFWMKYSTVRTDGRGRVDTISKDRWSTIDAYDSRAECLKAVNEFADYKFPSLDRANTPWQRGVTLMDQKDFRLSRVTYWHLECWTAGTTPTK
jgi:hypothetical protein